MCSWSSRRRCQPGESDCGSTRFFVDRAPPPESTTARSSGGAGRVARDTGPGHPRDALPARAPLGP
eukprot:1628248-Alexandrium_andersonii.AAC.1